MSMTSEDPAALLVDELRRDTELDGERDAEALARVRRGLELRLLPSSQVVGDAGPRGGAAVVALRDRKRWGARVGLVGALLVGTALGAGGHAMVSYVLPPGAAPSAAAPSAAVRSAAALGAPRAQPPLPSAEVQPLLMPVVIPSASTESPPVAGPSARSAQVVAVTPPRLDVELKELERARRDVARAPGQALRALEQQARRYPASMLRQEREALRLRALVGVGRFADARAAAEQFRASYPDSLLLDSVERAVASIP